MKKLHYSIQISTPKERVWDMMLNKATYNDWAKGFSAGSTYDGEFREGAEIRFTDPDLGGTKAIVEKYVPNQRVLMRHVSLISKEGTENTEGDMAQSWIGTTEEYVFEEVDGITAVTATMETDERFEGMFNDGFNKALPLLRQRCEEKLQD